MIPTGHTVCRPYAHIDRPEFPTFKISYLLLCQHPLISAQPSCRCAFHNTKCVRIHMGSRNDLLLTLSSLGSPKSRLNIIISLEWFPFIRNIQKTNILRAQSWLSGKINNGCSSILVTIHNNCGSADVWRHDWEHYIIPTHNYSFSIGWIPPVHALPIHQFLSQNALHSTTVHSNTFHFNNIIGPNIIDHPVLIMPCPRTPHIIFLIIYPFYECSYCKLVILHVNSIGERWLSHSQLER